MRGSAKQLISLGLLGLMLVKACVIPLLYLDFEIRRDYIINNLCENRNRPMLNCNGKCYLAKKLAEARKQEEKQAESDFLSKLFSTAVDLSSLRIPEIKNTHLNFLLENPTRFAFQCAFRPSEIVSEIFHPPLLA